MRVLVCGGRKYNNIDAVWEALNALVPTRAESELVIIHGDCTGADSIADKWANAHGVPVVKFPADWRKYGRRAGPIRNQWMIVEGKPDLVLAFPGGPGTANMVFEAKVAGVEVMEIK